MGFTCPVLPKLLPSIQISAQALGMDIVSKPGAGFSLVSMVLESVVVLVLAAFDVVLSFGLVTGRVMVGVFSGLFFLGGFKIGWVTGAESAMGWVSSVGFAFGIGSVS